jgi:hypothetical protein
MGISAGRLRQCCGMGSAESQRAKSRIHPRSAGQRLPSTLSGGRPEPTSDINRRKRLGRSAPRHCQQVRRPAPTKGFSGACRQRHARFQHSAPEAYRLETTRLRRPGGWWACPLPRCQPCPQYNRTRSRRSCHRRDCGSFAPKTFLGAADGKPREASKPPIPRGASQRTEGQPRTANHTQQPDWICVPR